jgi:hypothetical protein
MRTLSVVLPGEHCGYSHSFTPNLSTPAFSLTARRVLSDTPLGKSAVISRVTVTVAFAAMEAQVAVVAAPLAEEVL